MYDEIKDIYDALFSHIITPFNLLENAKLPNYSYVKYYKNNDGLVAEIKCFVEGDGEAVFYYYFDNKDRLNMVVKNTNGKSEVVFEREKELINAIKRYNIKRSSEKKAVV